MSWTDRSNNSQSILTLILKDGLSFEMIPSGSYGLGKETSGPVIIFSAPCRERVEQIVKAFAEIKEKL